MQKGRMGAVLVQWRFDLHSIQTLYYFEVLKNLIEHLNVVVNSVIRNSESSVMYCAMFLLVCICMYSNRVYYIFACIVKSNSVYL